MTKCLWGLVGLLCCFIFSNCSSTKTLGQDAPLEHVDEVSFVDDKVLVLFLDMQAAVVFIRGARIIDGYFKPLFEDLRQKESVRIQYLDQTHRVLFEKVLDNPLIQYKEYDDEGKMKRIRVELEKGSILLRSKHSTDIKMIRVDYGVDKNYKTIATLPLEVTS